MRILVTGGTGFIGAEIVRQLFESGESDIHVLHRSGNFQRLHGLTEDVHFIESDLADHERMSQIIHETKPEVIYHLGAMLTTPSEGNPQASLQINAIGMIHLLEAARQAEVRQVLFASSVGSYGADIQTEAIDDLSIQRPFTIYGIAKVFGEQLGGYYKRKYGLDFRGLRYPSIIGPGVKTFSIVQFTSWMIEEPAKGKPFTVSTRPETAVPVMYFKDAARAMIQLGDAPLEAIKTVNYVIDGFKPTPTVSDIAEAVRQKIPTAQITFEPDPQLQGLLDQILRPLDDSRARSEWGWMPAYDQTALVDDFLSELGSHPERYV